MLKSLRRHTWLVLLFVTSSLNALGQTVEDEHTVFEELPSESAYTAFSFSGDIPQAYSDILYERLPVIYNFRGEERKRITIGGMNIADGITLNRQVYVSRRVRQNSLCDTLSPSSQLWGYDNCQVVLHTTEGSRTNFGVMGIAGYSSAGVFAHYADRTEVQDLDLRLRCNFGPDIYNNCLHNLRTFASLALRRGRWSVVVLSAPSYRNLRSASTYEAFALSDNPYYNPSCGEDNGQIRNAAIERSWLPTAIVSHDWEWERTKLSLSVGARAGLHSRSGIDYYNTSSPYPDHYSVLPSNLTSPDQVERLTQAWRNNDISVTGVNWSRLRHQNRGGVAQYVVASRNERSIATNASAIVTHRIDSRTRLMLETSLRYDNSAMYKRIDDLLGATHAPNIDFYSSDINEGRIAYNNVADTHLLVVGDRSDYNYLIDRLQAVAIGTLSHNMRLWTLNASLRLATQSFSRRGLWLKSTRADSYGRGGWHTSPDCALDLTAIRHSNNTQLMLNGWFRTSPPTYNQLYLAPENSAATIATQAIPLHYGLTVSYSLQSDIVSGVGSIYLNRRRGDFQTTSYYDHIVGRYVNCETNGINSVGIGADLGVDIHLGYSHSLSAAIAWHYDRYTSNPRSNLYDDCDGTLLAQGLRVGLQGLRPARTPSFVAALGYNGWLPRNWLLKTQLSYITGRYIAPEQLYRMEHVTRLCTSAEQLSALTRQNRLGGALFLEFTLGKQIYLQHHSLFISLSAQAQMAGDQTQYAYEQRRLLRNYASGLPTYRQSPLKRTYGYPLTAVLSISYTL